MDSNKPISEKQRGSVYGEATSSSLTKSSKSRALQDTPMAEQLGSRAVKRKPEARASARATSESHVRGGGRQTGSKGRDGNQEHWTALIKDRNRINAQKNRKKQQEQLCHLEAENTRLSVSNDALRYHNRHLQVAINDIKEYTSTKKPPPSSNATPQVNVAALPPPAQQHNHTAPNILNPQQQLSALLLANDSSSRIEAQALALTAAAFASSNPELSSALLQPPPPTPVVPTPSRVGNTIIGLSSLPGVATAAVAAAPLFCCCNEYRAFCALDPAIQQVFQGDRHHPLCQNFLR